MAQPEARLTVHQYSALRARATRDVCLVTFRAPEVYGYTLGQAKLATLAAARAIAQRIALSVR